MRVCVVCACVLFVCLCICVVCTVYAMCTHVWFVSVYWHLLFFFTLSVPLNCPGSSDFGSYFSLCLFLPLTLLLRCYFVLYFSLMCLSFLCSMTEREGRRTGKTEAEEGDKLHFPSPQPPPYTFDPRLTYQALPTSAKGEPQQPSQSVQKGSTASFACPKCKFTG